MSASSAPSPPTAISDGASQMPQLPPLNNDISSPSSSRSNATSSSIVIVIIVIASAVIISASIYLLLRLLSKRLRRSSTSSAADDVVLRRDSSNQQQCQAANASLLDYLPLFPFRSVNGYLTGGDCAVCLSKFEPHDQLRLLPICCHAFHADCIDTWIVSNQTCPLCRSAVIASDAEVFDKIQANPNRGIASGGLREGNGNSGSFRIEIGSISRRRGGGAPEATEGGRRSYSIGSFDYIVDDNGYEVPVGSTAHRRGPSAADKEPSVGALIPEPPGEALTADVSSGRNWLRDYMDRLASVSISSRAVSFRSSGRFFTGSSRRSDAVAAAVTDDLEANQVGEEISELFRWLSGI